MMMWWLKAVAFVKKWWAVIVGVLSVFTWFASRRRVDRDISNDEELADALRRGADLEAERKEVQADAELERERASADGGRAAVLERMRERRRTAGKP